MPVRQLPPALVDKLRTDVNLNNVPQAVAELLANAIDAEARNICVLLNAKALDFTVEDDGAGIRSEDLELLGGRYSTSKMRSMADLQSGIRTLGFRGEAVSSLFDIADVCVTSRARGTFVTLTKKVQAGGGKVLMGPSAIQLAHSGTSVCVKRFLFNQPVRQRQLTGQHKDTETGTTQAVLRMALPFTDVSVTLQRMPTAQTLLHLPAGRNVAVTFLRLVPEQPPSLPLLVAARDRGYRASAVLGSPAAAYPHQHHQYMYVNRRHVRSPQLAALLNDHFLRAYQRAGYHQAAAARGGRGPADADSGGAGAGRGAGSSVKAYPAFLILLECPYGDYDVTSEPDKSDVVFRQLPVIQALLRDLAVQAWGCSGGPVRDAEGVEGPAGAGQQQEADKSRQVCAAAAAGRTTAAGEDGGSARPLHGAPEQPVQQRRPAALPRAHGPMQSLLQLQAAGGNGIQLGQSKSRSLAALLTPEADAPGTVDSRKRKAAQTEPVCAGDGVGPFEPSSGQAGGGRSARVSEGSGGGGSGGGGGGEARGAMDRARAAVRGDELSGPQMQADATVPVAVAADSRKRKAAQADLNNLEGLGAGVYGKSPVRAGDGFAFCLGNGHAARAVTRKDVPFGPRHSPIAARGAMRLDAKPLSAYGWEAGRRSPRNRGVHDPDANDALASWDGFRPVAMHLPGERAGPAAEVDYEYAFGAALGDDLDSIDAHGDLVFTGSPSGAVYLGGGRRRVAAAAGGTDAGWLGAQGLVTAGLGTSPLLPEISPEHEWQRRKPTFCSGSPLPELSPGLGYTPPAAAPHGAASTAAAYAAGAAIDEAEDDSPLFVREVRRQRAAASVGGGGGTADSPFFMTGADADDLASPSPAVVRAPMPGSPVMISPSLLTHAPMPQSPMVGAPPPDAGADGAWRFQRDQFNMSPLWDLHRQGRDLPSPRAPHLYLDGRSPPPPRRRLAASPSDSDFMIADEWAGQYDVGDLAASRAAVCNAPEERGDGSWQDAQAWAEDLSPDTVQAIAKVRLRMQSEQARRGGGAAEARGVPEVRAWAGILAPERGELTDHDGGGGGGRVRQDAPPAALAPAAGGATVAAVTVAAAPSKALLPTLPKRGDGLDAFLSGLRDSPDGAAAVAAAMSLRKRGAEAAPHPAPSRQCTTGTFRGGRPPITGTTASSETMAATAQRTTAEAPAPAGTKSERDAVPPAAAAAESSRGAAAKLSSAIPGAQRDTPVIVGMALPTAGGSRDGGDDDEESSLSPLARFLNFGNVGSDPGVTPPPPCPLAAAAERASIAEGGAPDAGSISSSAKTGAAADAQPDKQRRRQPGAERNTGRAELRELLNTALATPAKISSPTRLVQSAPPHAKTRSRTGRFGPRCGDVPSRRPRAAPEGPGAARLAPTAANTAAAATSVTGVTKQAAWAAAAADGATRKPAQATPKHQDSASAPETASSGADASCRKEVPSADWPPQPSAGTHVAPAVAPVCSFRWPAARAALGLRQHAQGRVEPGPQPQLQPQQQQPQQPQQPPQQQQHRDVLCVSQLATTAHKEPREAVEHADGGHAGSTSGQAACGSAALKSAALHASGDNVIGGTAAATAAAAASAGAARSIAACISDDSDSQAQGQTGSQLQLQPHTGGSTSAGEVPGNVAGSADGCGAAAAAALDGSSGTAAAVAPGARLQVPEQAQPGLGSDGAAPSGRTPGGILRKRSLSSVGRTPKRVRFHLPLGAGAAGAPRPDDEQSPQQHRLDGGSAPVRQGLCDSLLQKQPGLPPPVPLAPRLPLAPAPVGLSTQGQQQQQDRHQFLGVPQDARRVLSLELDLMRLAAPGEQLVPSNVSRSALAGPAARVMRQVDRKFIPVMSSGGALLIIDQHAAHERVRLEQLTEQLTEQLRAATAAARGGRAAGAGGNGGDAAPAAPPATDLLCVQPLAPPVALQLATNEAAALARHAGVVAAWGWRLRSAGGGGGGRGGAATGGGGGVAAAGAGAVERSTLRLTMLMLQRQQQQQQRQLVTDADNAQVLIGVPSVYGTALTSQTDLRAYLQQLHETGGADLPPPAVLRVLRSKACRTAVMFGDALEPDMCAALLAQLRVTRLWTQCAHGRPTVAPLAHLPTLRAVLERRRLGAARGASEGADPWVGKPGAGIGRQQRRLSVAALRAALKRGAERRREREGDGGVGGAGEEEQ